MTISHSFTYHQPLRLLGGKTIALRVKKGVLLVGKDTTLEEELRKFLALGYIKKTKEFADDPDIYHYREFIAWGTE